MKRWLEPARYRRWPKLHGEFTTPGVRMDAGAVQPLPAIPAACSWCAACSTNCCRTSPASSSTSAATKPSTWGRAGSKEECEERGTERVYLDYLLKIHDEVTERGYTMQFWGDIIVQAPDMIAELPKDSIALEWGYEADHPFDEHGKAFAARASRSTSAPAPRPGPRSAGAPTTQSATCSTPPRTD